MFNQNLILLWSSDPNLRIKYCRHANVNTLALAEKVVRRGIQSSLIFYMTKKTCIALQFHIEFHRPTVFVIFTTGALTQEGSPQFMGDNFDGNGYTSIINQNSRVGDEIVQVKCVNPDMINNVTYSLVREDRFAIDEHSGIVTLEIDALALREGNYSVIILCQAMDSSLTSNTRLLVIYRLENQYAPIYDHGLTVKVSISEDQNITNNPHVVTLNATDNDLGVYGRIMFEITYGNDDDLFSINEDTGDITLNRELDYEMSQAHSLIVTACNPRLKSGDDTRSAVATVHIQVINVNDERPIFTNHSYYFRFDENTEPHDFL